MLTTKAIGGADLPIGLPPVHFGAGDGDALSAIAILSGAGRSFTSHWNAAARQQAMEVTF